MTNPNAVPLLTAEDAKECVVAKSVGVRRVAIIEHALEAIASGEAVVIPRITREALREALGPPDGELTAWDEHDFRRPPAWSKARIIAALKRLGVPVGE